MNTFFYIFVLALFYAARAEDEYGESQRAQFRSLCPKCSFFTELAPFERTLELENTDTEESFFAQEKPSTNEEVEMKLSLMVFVDVFTEETMKLAPMLQFVAKDRPVVVLDVSQNATIAEKYTSETPFLRTVANGSPWFVYPYPIFTPLTLSHFFNRANLNGTVQVLSLSEIDEASNESPIALGVFRKENEGRLEEFTQIAELGYSMFERFAYIFADSFEEQKKVFDHFNVTADFHDSSLSHFLVIPIKSLNKTHSPVANVGEDFSEISILRTIDYSHLPDFGEVNHRSFRYYRDFQLTEFWFLFTLDKVEQYSDMIRSEILPYRGRGVFFWMNNETEWLQANHVHFSLKRVPALSIVDHDGFYVFGEEEEFTQEGLRKFISDFASDKLSPHIKSEELTVEQLFPKDETIGKLSFKHFENYVLNVPNIEHFILLTFGNCSGECLELRNLFVNTVEKHSEYKEKYKFYTYDLFLNQQPFSLPRWPYPILAGVKNKILRLFHVQWEEQALVDFFNDVNQDDKVETDQNQVERENENDESIEDLDSPNKNATDKSDDSLKTEL